MDLTISRPVRIFVLVAVVAAAAGGSMLMMKPKHSAAPPVVASQTPAAPAVTTTPAATAPAAKTPAANATAPAATSSTAKAGSTSKTAAAPTRKAEVAVPPVGDNGLPTSIDAAFGKHAIVVVSVFDPQSSTEAISYSEAKAGAADAGVGFVGVSLLDNTLAAALTSSLPGGGLLPTPGVLIYRKPGTLVQRIDGFADRDTVAQAAAASVTAPAVTDSGS